MANVLTAIIVDELEARGVEALQANAAPVASFANNYTAALVNGGETVKVPVYPAVTASTTKNDYENTTGVTITSVDVTLDKYQKHTGYLDDFEDNKLQIDTWGGQINESVKAVLKAVFQDMWTLMVAANFTETASYTGAGSAFDTDDVALYRRDLNKMGVKASPRNFLMTSDYSTGLVQDGALKDLSASGNVEALREGTVSRVAGLNILEADLITDNSENVVGWAGSPNSIGVAIRPLMPQSGAEKVQDFRTFTEPQTGLTMGLRIHYSAATGRKFYTVECQYGYAFVQDAGILMKSA